MVKSQQFSPISTKITYTQLLNDFNIMKQGIWIRFNRKIVCESIRNYILLLFSWCSLLWVRNVDYFRSIVVACLIILERTYDFLYLWFIIRYLGLSLEVDDRENQCYFKGYQIYWHLLHEYDEGKIFEKSIID